MRLLTGKPKQLDDNITADNRNSERMTTRNESESPFILCTWCHSTELKEQRCCRCRWWAQHCPCSFVHTTAARQGIHTLHRNNHFYLHNWNLADTCYLLIDSLMPFYLWNASSYIGWTAFVFVTCSVANWFLLTWTKSPVRVIFLSINRSNVICWNKCWRFNRFRSICVFAECREKGMKKGECDPRLDVRWAPTIYLTK